MKRFDRLDLLPEGQDMVAGIDMTGGFTACSRLSAFSRVYFSALSERQLPGENPFDML